MSQYQYKILKKQFMQNYMELKLIKNKNITKEHTLELEQLLLQDFSDMNVRKSLLFKASADKATLPMKVFHDFVDRYIIRRIRRPEIALPSNIVDENMQHAIHTPFQEYIYHITKETINEQAASLALSQRLSDQLFKVAPPSPRLLSSTEVLNTFLISNQSLIIQDLLKKENESMFKKFYHLRWFHDGSNERERFKPS